MFFEEIVINPGSRPGWTDFETQMGAGAVVCGASCGPKVLFHYLSIGTLQYNLHLLFFVSFLIGNVTSRHCTVVDQG